MNFWDKFERFLLFFCIRSLTICLPIMRMVTTALQSRPISPTSSCSLTWLGIHTACQIWHGGVLKTGVKKNLLLLHGVRWYYSNSWKLFNDKWLNHINMTKHNVLFCFLFQLSNWPPWATFWTTWTHWTPAPPTSPIPPFRISPRRMPPCPICLPFSPTKASLSIISQIQPTLLLCLVRPTERPVSKMRSIVLRWAPAGPGLTLLTSVSLPPVARDAGLKWLVRLPHHMAGKFFSGAPRFQCWPWRSHAHGGLKLHVGSANIIAAEIT